MNLIYKDFQINKRKFKVIKKPEDILSLNTIHHKVSFVFQETSSIFQTKFNIKKKDLVSKKVPLYIIEEVFVDLFFKDLETLFFRKNVITTESIIKDENIVKQKSPIIKKTKELALFNLDY